MKPNENDPVIDEIRDTRRRISAACGHDAKQLVAYYLKLQEKFRDRLIESPKPSQRADESAA